MNDRWYGESNGYYGESVNLYRKRYIPETVVVKEPVASKTAALTVGE